MVENQIDFDQIQRERLPTLYEVLIMKTAAPVDLWSFYTYLSQFPYAINYLDFWIDLMAHIRLCKDYVNNVRRSIAMTSAFDEYKNLDDQHPNQATNVSDPGSVSTSIVMNALVSEGYLDFDNPDRVSDFLQGNTHTSPLVTRMIQNWKNRNERSSGMSSQNGNATNDVIDISKHESVQSISVIVDSFLKAQAKNGEKGNITTKQLYTNAVQICNTYLQSPHVSERYLTNIPEVIKHEILTNIKMNKRHDPDVFQELKEMTYHFLEADCFPKFLKEVALHNIHDEISDWRFHPSKPTNSPPNTLLEKDDSSSILKKNSIHAQHISWSPFSTFTALSRVLFGCLWLGIGFWIGYTLIFIHYSRAIRVTTVVPFGIGSYFIICGIYQFDIIYSWFGLTQKLIYTHKKGKDKDVHRATYDNSYNTNIPSIFLLLGGRSRLIKIEHPFIRRLLYKRGLWCLILVVLMTAIFTVIFSCVPGRRL
ncbi:Bud site selection protein RAX1 [Nakaseomyces bracarensis]|uniref:Bud site selection protein RAX1 n=1 Tax=Nakaseomyces bracarensis TaxID=273131 RepID=A0ABR4NNA8_9SACH